MLRAQGDPQAIALWDAYLAFLKSCPELSDKVGTAVHHILWRAEYPQFKTAKWNLIRLSHKNHTRASALLVAAEPTSPKLLTSLTLVSGKTTIGPVQSRLLKFKDEILEWYIKDGWTVHRLAKRFRTSHGPLAVFLRHHGVVLRSVASLNLWKPKNPNEVIRLYVNEGWRTKDIGKKYKVSAHPVLAFLRRHNIPIRRPGYRLGWSPRNPDDVISLYVDKKWTTGAIAKRFRVSDSSVDRFLQRHNIACRRSGWKWSLRSRKAISKPRGSYV